MFFGCNHFSGSRLVDWVVTGDYKLEIWNHFHRAGSTRRRLMVVALKVPRFHLFLIMALGYVTMDLQNISLPLNYITFMFKLPAGSYIYIFFPIKWLLVFSVE